MLFTDLIGKWDMAVRQMKPSNWYKTWILMRLLITFMTWRWQTFAAFKMKANSNIILERITIRTFLWVLSFEETNAHNDYHVIFSYI